MGSANSGCSSIQTQPANHTATFTTVSRVMMMMIPLSTIIDHEYLFMDIDKVSCLVPKSILIQCVAVDEGNLNCVLVCTLINKNY